MMGFLGQVSPNTWAGLLGLAVTFGTWLYHDIRGDQQASLLDNLKGLGKQVIHILVTDPAVTSAIDPTALQAKAKALLLQLAAAAKLPVDNAIAQALADQVAQHVVGDALDELRQLDQTNTRNLNTIAVQARAIAAMLAGYHPPTAYDGEVEVQPDGSLKGVATIPPKLPGGVPVLKPVPGDVQSPK